MCENKHDQRKKIVIEIGGGFGHPDHPHGYDLHTHNKKHWCTSKQTNHRKSLLMPKYN